MWFGEQNLRFIRSQFSVDSCAKGEDYDAKEQRGERNVHTKDMKFQPATHLMHLTSSCPASKLQSLIEARPRGYWEAIVHP